MQTFKTSCDQSWKLFREHDRYDFYLPDIVYHWRGGSDQRKLLKENPGLIDLKKRREMMFILRMTFLSNFVRPQIINQTFLIFL